MFKKNTVLKSFPNKTNNYDSIIKKNVFWAFIFKGGGVVISLLSTPAFIKYFNDDVILGVWYTILSVLTWILNFDLGIGNGLRNHLTVSLSEGNTKKSKELISTSYIAFALLVVSLSVVGYFLAGFVNWNTLFNISTNLVSADAMLTVVRCIFIGIMLQFFLRLINSVLYAMQNSAIINAMALTISVLQLLFVLLVPSESPEEGLITLSYAYIAIISLPSLCVTVVLFMGKLKNVRPAFKAFRKDSLKSVMSVGGIIFVCQILYMIIINTNNFFISHYTNPENVVEYDIFNKLFSLVGTVTALIMSPLWSLITKAISEKDFAWVRKLYKKIMIMVGITAFMEFAIIPFMKPIIKIWLGENVVEVNYLYLLVYALWGSVFTLHNALSTFACGTSKMKTQTICYAVGIVVKLAFLYLVFQVSSNWIFVMISNILILIPYCIAQHLVLKKQLKFNEKEVMDCVQE
ncbi:MAG: MATE family efflux transporter [Oscillospiraceae bacterium]|nr:MATE family efflux transporter [Oscillospiraceae bacterium]